MKRRIERQIDQVLEAAPGTLSETEAQLRAAKARAESRRERLAAAVADGVLLADEAAGQLEKIRAELADIEARTHALRFRVKRTKSLHSERGRLIQAALDFPAVAARATGRQARELVLPWIGRATFDKVERVLTLGIRTVPALPSFEPYMSPGPEGHDQVGMIVRRRSLLQEGHEYRVADAAAAMQDDKRRRA